MNDTRTIDGFGPLPVERPGSAAELCGIVRRAAAAGKAIYSVGGGTLLHLGRVPTKLGAAVDLSGLNQVIDYPARDLTITVQAGLTMGRLQEVLAAEKQWLPIDIGSHSTIGGAIATNTSGQRRFGYGTLRDYVIGISFVTDEGLEVKAGGRVVKNVAGYDLCKLQVGALGTLGILTQVTLKVRPLPERRAEVWLCCDLSDLPAFLDTVHSSHIRPVSLWLTTAGYRLLRPRVAPPQEPVLYDSIPSFNCELIVGFEEKAETVDWEVRQFQQEIGEYPNNATTGPMKWEPPPGPFRPAAAEFVEFQANLLPSATARFIQQALTAGEVRTIEAYPGNGIVRGLLIQADFTRAREALASLLAEAVAAQGNLVIQQCPTAWKAELPIWGRPRGDLALMQAVKDQLDPRRIFNPGRYLDGL